MGALGAGHPRQGRDHTTEVMNMKNINVELIVLFLLVLLVLALVLLLWVAAFLEVYCGVRI